MHAVKMYLCGRARYVVGKTSYLGGGANINLHTQTHIPTKTQTPPRSTNKPQGAAQDHRKPRLEARTLVVVNLVC